MTIESICVGLVAVVVGVVCILGGIIDIPILKDVQFGKRLGFGPKGSTEAGNSGRWRLVVLGVLFLLLGTSFLVGYRFPWQ